ncbi:MAG: ATP-binding protein [Moraxella sp.]|nr:ATP-binding protein [Moraxella sp.]
MSEQRRQGLRSAYGQLILIVFLPIAILASVGAVLVFFETTRAIKSEQDVLAQAALIRYEPFVRPLLPSLSGEDYAVLQDRINEMGINGMTEALSPSESVGSIGRRYMSEQMYRVQSEQHVKRIGILDAKGVPILGVGFRPDAPWGRFDVTADGIWRQRTEVGTAYGMPMYATINGTQRRFWLFVDMDNEPLVIARYRILLALAITGLTTMLLLLLILNLYSKRWIAPIYEMRLHLQKTEADNLKTLATRSDGEFYLLQKELNATLKRLNSSFSDLKTHSEQTEADLQQAFDEMEIQNISIRKARDVALQASEAKSLFLANVSHELRTPLNAIDGFINLLSRDGKLDSKQSLYVQTIKKSSAHLLALINDVLDFSKIEAGKLTLDQQTFNLHEAVYEVADMLSPTAFDKGLRMSVLYYQDVPEELLGDKLRVKQILTNLLGNALKFTETGSVSIKVELADEPSGVFVDISVIDTGRGVDKHTQSMLFQSFEQGDISVTRRYGGTGLGLVICKQLTELMGGQIGFFDNQAISAEKSGATFWFRLPLNTKADLPYEPGVLPLPAVRFLAWVSHPSSAVVLNASLGGSAVSLVFARSFAHLLEMLTEDSSYDWVLVDSFGQKGDITALLKQVRLHYAGELLVMGYEVGLDTRLLEAYQAAAVYEPLNRRQLYDILVHKTTDVPAVSSSWQGVRVLAVDDHAPNLLVLEAFLAEFGVTVVQADSGFAAIDIMTAVYEGRTGERIDLIFMDISMPVMSGLAAATAIRKLEAAHHAAAIPIIALSAHGFDETAALEKAGMNDYASKPISHHELSLLLQKWLPSRHDVTSPLAENPSAVSARTALSFEKNTEQATAGDFLEPLSSDETRGEAVVLPVVDWQDALARASGKSALAKQLLGMMIDSVMDEKIALRRAWADKDKAKLSDVAHRIVGAARYAGVPALRAAAERFYTKSFTGRDDSSAKSFSELKPDFLVLMAALDDLMAVDLASIDV